MRRAVWRVDENLRIEAVEFAFDDPKFSYLPGDAIGVMPENDPELVDQLLRAAGLGSDAALLLKVQKGFDVTTLSRAAVDRFEEYRQFVDRTKRGLDGREQHWFAKSESQVLRLAGTLARLGLDDHQRFLPWVAACFLVLGLTVWAARRALRAVPC